MVSNLLLPLSVRGWVASPLALFALVCLSIRRFHDRDRSGWSLLWVLLPIIGAGWVVWQVALRRGVADDNRWGTDPLLNRADFLVVR